MSPIRHFQRILKRRSQAARARKSMRLGLESLEVRQLLAADLLTGPTSTVHEVQMGPHPVAVDSVSVQVIAAESVSATAFERFASQEQFDEFVLNRAKEIYDSYQNYDYPVFFPRPVFFDEWSGTGSAQVVPLVRQADARDASLESNLYASSNAQVANVDEADLIETDGEYLYVLSDQTLTIVDVRDPADLKTVSQTQFENQPTGMYLHGDRLTFIGGGPVAGLSPVGTYYWGGNNQIDIYDVSDPASPAHLRTTQVDGNITNSRMIGSQLHVVVEKYDFIPQPNYFFYSAIPFVDDFGWEDSGGTDYGNQESLTDYLERVRQAIPSMLPNYSTVAANGDMLANGTLVQVTDVYIPTSTDSSTSLTTIASIDVTDDSTGLIDSVALPSASSSTIYMNEGSLYVASHIWIEGQQAVEVHRFSIGDRIELTGATSLHGSLLNQFSMDEYNGYLRVAIVAQATDGTVNEVHILDASSIDLRTVGSITDIAPGETIRSVRFDGDDAYVVTFRQIDPFFTLDLATPDEPKLVGELKVTGFSDHLMRISDNLVIGFGQEANEMGWALHPQISLFDVSDFGNPQLLDRFSFPAEVTIPSWDHLGLTYVEEANLITVPANSYDYGLWFGMPEGDTQVVGNALYVFEVSRETGLTLRTIVDHPSHVSRSVAVDGTLLSISETSLVSTAIVGHENLDQLNFRSKAINDTYSVKNISDLRLDVLANDLVADDSNGIRIVEAFGNYGVNVVIADDGQSLVVNADQIDSCSMNFNDYARIACDPGFYLSQGFSYMIEDSSGGRSSAFVSINVAPELLAIDDWVAVTEGETVQIDVLSNDFLSRANGVAITEFNISNTQGTITLTTDEAGRQIFVYTPPTEFMGTDWFQYAISSADGESSWAQVGISVRSASIESPHDAARRFVNYSLEITDMDGNTVSQTALGERFVISLYVQDTSEEAMGVFAAYADVWFDPSLVAIDGEIEYGNAFGAARDGDANREIGVIDEIGAVAGISPNGANPLLVASIPFIAIGEGTPIFVLDAADDEIFHSTLVYGLSQAVLSDNISFQDVTLDIGVPRDPADINGDGVVSPLDALAMINELDRRSTIRAAATTRATETESVHDVVLLNAFEPWFDVNGDGIFSPLDPLAVIEALPSNATSKSTPTTGSASTPRAPLAQHAVASQVLDEESPATNRRRHSNVARRWMSTDSTASDVAFEQLGRDRVIDGSFSYTTDLESD